MKKYTKPPLPFHGNKRNFLKEYAQVLQGSHKINESTAFVDLFGWSGLLSHVTKYHFPNNRVVWNDYDDYANRLQNIRTTNILIGEIRQIVATWAYKRNGRIDDQTKQCIITILEELKREGKYIDYKTVSTNILFSQRHAFSVEEFRVHQLYDKVTNSPYEADGYLEWVERVSEDWKTLYDRFADDANAVFVMDPPYLNTNNAQYKINESWTLSNFLEIVTAIENKGFILFTSKKSSTEEFIRFLNEKTNLYIPYALVEKEQALAAWEKYTEQLIHNL